MFSSLTSDISSIKDTFNKDNINERRLNKAIDTLTLNQRNLSLISDE